MNEILDKIEYFIKDLLFFENTTQKGKIWR